MMMLLLGELITTVVQDAQNHLPGLSVGSIPPFLLDYHSSSVDESTIVRSCSGGCPRAICCLVPRRNVAITVRPTRPVLARPPPRHAQSATAVHPIFAFLSLFFSFKIFSFLGPQRCHYHSHHQRTMVNSLAYHFRGVFLMRQVDRSACYFRCVDRHCLHITDERTVFFLSLDRISCASTL